MAYAVGGLTLDQFYDLTHRQVFHLLQAADEEEFQRLNFEASIHGAKLKEQFRPTVFSKEADEELTRIADEKIKEMRANA